MTGVFNHGKFCGRWRHRMTLHFRVWPRYKKAIEAIRTRRDFPINAMYINEAGHMEVQNCVHGKNTHCFEMEDDDLDVLTAVSIADAKLSGSLHVRAPGTLDERVKKDCWLDVPVVVYPNAPYRVGESFCEDSVPFVRQYVTDTVEEAVAQSGVAGSKTILLEHEEDIDEDLILRKVVEDDACVVFVGRRDAKGVVSSRRARELVARALYWVVEGRRPEEEGGLLCGYQFADRFIRWARSANASPDGLTHLDRMHEVTRERGRRSRRAYFIDNLANRFAERVGMSRQRVMAKLLDDGMMDVILRSVDQVRPIQGRPNPALLGPRVVEAVNTLEFYYRTLGRMGASGRGMNT